MSEATATPARPRSWSSRIPIPLRTGLLAVALMFSITGERFGVAESFAVLLVALEWCVVDRKAAQLDRRAALASTLGLVTLAPLVVMSGLRGLVSPLAEAKQTWYCGTGDVEASVLACSVAFGWGTFAAVLATALDFGRRERTRAILRRIAVFATLGLAGLVALSFVRLASGPTIDRYVESLPRVASLGPVAPNAARADPNAADSHADLRAERSVGVGSRRVVLVCRAGHCGVGIARGGHQRTTVDAWAARHVMRWQPAETRFEVHRDRGHRM